MNIIIAGGSGFIGRNLVKHFLQKKFNITVIGRRQKKIVQRFSDDVTPLTWDTLTPDAFKQADVVINLAGATIGEKRWSNARKNEILSSRIITTQTIAKLCAQLGTQAPALFNASAVGVYGLQSAAPQGLPPAFDENSAIDFQHAEDFLAEVARKWELATQLAKQAGVRVVNMRFGVVLDNSGGALSQLKLPFLLGIGGPVGKGQQPFSWVALDDLMRAIDFLMAHPDINGPVNIVAPGCVFRAPYVSRR